MRVLFLSYESLLWRFFYIIYHFSFFVPFTTTHSFLATGPFGGSCQIHGPIPMPQSESEELSTTPIDAETGDHPSGIKSPIIHNPPKPPAFSHSYCPPEIHRSCFCVRFIAEHTKMQEDSTKVRLLLLLYVLCYWLIYYLYTLVFFSGELF